MKSLRNLVIVALILLFAPCLTQSAKADPLFFSNVVGLQNGGLTSVDLFSNPGATLFGPQISFLVDVTGVLPTGVTNTLQLTYIEEGSAPIIQSFPIPLFGTVDPPFSLLFTINSPGANFQGISATLLIDIIGSSPDFIIPGGPGAGQSVDTYTYTFIVAQPVPEPTTLFLVGVGLGGLLVRGRLKR